MDTHKLPQYYQILGQFTPGTRAFPRGAFLTAHTYEWPAKRTGLYFF